MRGSGHSGYVVLYTRHWHTNAAANADHGQRATGNESANRAR